MPLNMPQQRSKENAGHAHAQVGVDEHQLAAGDQAAVGRELDRCAAVPIQLDDVAWLDVGQLSERQVDRPSSTVRVTGTSSGPAAVAVAGCAEGFRERLDWLMG